MLPEASGEAHARAGLLGNPSDAYGGRAIAFSIRNFSARVTLRRSDRLVIRAGPSDLTEFASLRQAHDMLGVCGCDDGVRLLRAAIRRLSSHWEGLAALPEDDPRLRFEISYETDIPRQVGLGGSSAIVIAALRALMAWFEITIDPAVLAELALAAEVEDLGIAAGPMDRVIQSYGGVLFMDLRAPRTSASYLRLPAEMLPPLYVAWDPRGGEPSGRVHRDVRRRFEEGDEVVRREMETLAGLADEGLACLRCHDHATFRELMNRNFDTRARLFSISAADREMVDIGRALGGAAKLCGSGGAVVGAPIDGVAFDEIAAAYRGAGYALLVPVFEGASDWQRVT